MSTASLPSYLAPPFAHTPAYSAEPQAFEQRIALADSLRPRPSGNFVKQSKNGDVRLRLTAQENNVTLPVYGSGGSVEGTVELSKADSITSVEVKIEGRLCLREIAEGGTATAKLCLDTALLWTKSPSGSSCPSSLSFCLNLPATFSVQDKTYPLPPTYDVKLSGLPGFTATIDYSVAAVINKTNSVPNLASLKSSLFGLGNTTVSTPFVYYPRTRPASPLPHPMLKGQYGFLETPEWRPFPSVIRSKTPGGQDIFSKLYLPASRIFCLSQPIPFHLTLQSSAFSLASFLPFSPTTNSLSTKRLTRIQLMRQSTVDVRGTTVLGTKTDIWRVDCIGEGTFKLAGDGPNWISFVGEIAINDNVKVTGFKAAGLTIKDCILLSMVPSDALKSPFSELRQLVPIRLTTDLWTADGTGVGADYRLSGSHYSIPSDPDDFEEAQPTLDYTKAH